MTSSGEDNVTLAATNQLLGTCRLLGGGKAEQGYRDFSAAIDYTPYDPDAYLLRTVAALGAGRAESAIGDLDRALQLDPEYPPARRLTAAVAAIANERGVSALGILTGLHGHAFDTGELLRRYAIAPDMPPR
jgi:tetratricopeptide (TPR) repeat protein